MSTIPDERGPSFERADLLPERLAEWLRGEIVEGRLAPGERLVEQTLTQRCGVSRVPLREALRIVAADGLVTLAPHRGAVVTGLSARELTELFEVRIALEGRAAALAALHRTAEDLAALHALVSDMRDAVTAERLDAYHQQAAQFHSALLAASQNEVLKQLYDKIKVRFRRYQAAMARVPSLPTQSIDEHQIILSAIENNNAEAARKLAEHHIKCLISKLKID